MPWEHLSKFLSSEKSKCKGPVSLLSTLWHDNKLSAMLSTFGSPKMVEWMRRTKSGEYKRIAKPSANILYSAIMDAVDVADRHLTDIGISIRTNKWYLNVFCMILSAAVVEAYSCYTEENTGEKLSRDHFLRRLMNECARAKYTSHGSLQTVGPAHFKPVEIGKKTPKKRKSPTPNETPPLVTEAKRRAHSIITLKKRGHCKHCVTVRKLGTYSRLAASERAARTTRFCVDCNMFLCKNCSKSRKEHRVANKRRRIWKTINKIYIDTASGGVKLIKFCTKIIKKFFHFFYAIPAWWSKNSTKI